MKAGNKSRRSPRIPARHNIMLLVNGAEGPAKEVVTTVHISQHGAHLIARRRLEDNSRGTVAHLSTCKQAPFRIAWQSPSTSQPGYHEMGIEFEELSDFWGASFAVAGHSPEPAQGAQEKGGTDSELITAEVLDLLRTVPSGSDGRDVTDALWCGLVEQLEARQVISRSELIACLRQIGLQLD